MASLLRAAAAIALVAAAPARAVDVALVLSERSPAYQEAADAVRGALEPQTDVVVLGPADLGSLNPNPPRLLVPVGLQALKATVDADLRVPLLAVLVLRTSYEAVMERGARRPASAVFLDQPLGRHLDLLRAALPDRRRVAALLGPESAAQAEALRVAARERGLALTIARVGGPEEIYGALQGLLPHADVLVALPDPAVWGAGTIQNILRTLYRESVPLVAFSASYVKAGATLAVHSTPEQVGRQAGQAARAFLAGRPLPAPQPPQQFHIAVNRPVARSLGLRIPDDEPLGIQLRLWERHP
ncbi:MAG: hypothetical protein JNK22_13890 [Rhodocyclaceae bacterium]|nr:hypothetical protein [Rhodocyclaceae bacterium]